MFAHDGDQRRQDLKCSRFDICNTPCVGCNILHNSALTNHWLCLYEITVKEHPSLGLQYWQINSDVDFCVEQPYIIQWAFSSRDTGQPNLQTQFCTHLDTC